MPQWGLSMSSTSIWKQWIPNMSGCLHIYLRRMFQHKFQLLLFFSLFGGATPCDGFPPASGLSDYLVGMWEFKLGSAAHKASSLLSAIFLQPYFLTFLVKIANSWVSLRSFFFLFWVSDYLWANSLGSCLGVGWHGGSTLVALGSLWYLEFSFTGLKNYKGLLIE